MMLCIRCDAPVEPRLEAQYRKWGAQSGLCSRCKKRDLDLKVALNVMGWHGPVTWKDDGDGCEPYAFEPSTDPEYIAANNQDHNHSVPRYSDDMRAAWEVVEQVKDADWGRGFFVRWCDYAYNNGPIWEAGRISIGDRGENEYDVLGEGETAATAVCLAALDIAARKRER